MVLRRPKPATLFWLAGWGVLVVAGLTLRPPLLVDETRYLGVAWEMWTSGDWLVPHLNGEPYSHKPPLLFWLINLVWGLFGVSETGARLVAPLFGLGSLWMTGVLAGRLWPETPLAAKMAPVLLLGVPVWAGFQTLTYFDMLTGFFALTALYAGWRAAHGGGPRSVWGWFIACGLAIGLGVLAKGPVILVHVLPVLLAAPWWAPEGLPRGRWYAGLAVALMAGTAVGLAWVLPAASAGGEAFGDELLWGQTAGRLSQSFAHGQPWWFYGAVLPVMLLPWVLWPGFWRGLCGLGARFADPGLRFCLIWFVGALLVLSLISAKQVHYLLPSLPGALLLVAWLAAKTAPDPAQPEGPLPGLGLALITLGVIVLATVTRQGPIAEIAAKGHVGWLAIGMVAALLAAAARPMALFARAAAIAAATAALVVTAHLAASPYLFATHDVSAVARRIAAFQEQGLAVLHVSKYRGQYHFAGRLRAPLDWRWEHETGPWIEAHAKGRVISYHDHGLGREQPIYTARFKGRRLAIRDLNQVRGHPSMINRSYGTPENPHRQR